MNLNFDTFNFDTFSDVWAEAMLQATLQGVVLITIALATVFLFGKHFTSRTNCWIWRLVFLKLILLMLIFKPIGVPVLPSALTLPNPPNQVVMEGGSAVAISAASDSFSLLNHSPQNDTIAFQPELEAGGAVSSPESPVLHSNFSLLNVLCAFWLVGVLTCLCLLTRFWFSSKNLRKLSVPLEDSRIREYCRELCDKFEIKSVPRLSVSDAAASPLLIGVFRPEIIFPAATLEVLNSEQLKLVIAHELSHLKRRDLWWSWIPAVSAVLFFFNPFVWWARGRWHLSREMACDELVLSVTKKSAARYADALIDVSNSIRNSNSTSVVRRVIGSTCMIQTNYTLQRRIKAMKNYSRFSSYSLQTMILFGLASMIVVTPWKLVQSHAKASGPPSVDSKELNDDQSSFISEDQLRANETSDSAYYDEPSPLIGEYQRLAAAARESGDRDAQIAILKEAESALENMIKPMFATGTERQLQISHLLQVHRLLNIKALLGTQKGEMARFEVLFEEAYQRSGDLSENTMVKIFISHRDCAWYVGDFDRAAEVMLEAFETLNDTKLKRAFLSSAANAYRTKARQFDNVNSRENFTSYITAILNSIHVNSKHQPLYDRDTYEMLIDVIAKTKNHDQNIVWLKESLLSSPELSLTHLLIGVSMIQKGNLQDGKNHWHIAFKLDINAQTILANFISVASLDKENRIDDVLKINLAALEMFEHPLLDQALGQNYLAMGNVETATELFEVTIEKNPKLMLSHHYLVKCYQKLGNSEKAAYHQEKLDQYFSKLDPAQRDQIKGRLENL